MRIFLIVTSFAVGLLFTANNFVQAQTSSDKDKLAGRWELCTPDGKTSENPNVRQKIYTKDSYVVLEVDKSDNTTYVDFIGKTDVDAEGKLTETLIYTDSRLKQMRSQSFDFSFKVEGKYLYLKGLNGNPFNEIWIKVSD